MHDFNWNIQVKVSSSLYEEPVLGCFFGLGFKSDSGCGEKRQ